MIRLIVADKMKESVDFYAKNLCCEDLVPNLPRIIDEVPAADAIPMEWLREKAQIPCMTCDNPFDYVLTAWEEESR